MSNPVCLIPTPKIRELAAKFPNETVESVKNLVSLWQAKNNKSNAGTIIESEYEYEYGTCVKCGAWLGQLGWEETPELFVSHLCDILDESRRVLKDTGVLFVNMG